MAETYGAQEIQVLEGLEAVRRRPAMYIGGIDAIGLHHLIEEVVDNAIDEAMAGYCKNIRVTIHADGSLSVEDDGRGIPVDIHPEESRPAVEVVMTKLHAGGKFGGKRSGYRVSGGLHGVGVSVVNALSEWLVVEVKRQRKIYRQRYERGQPVTELEVVGRVRSTGTKVTFKPDPEIFRTTEFGYERLAQRLRELAYLNGGVKIVLTDERTRDEETGQPVSETFYYKGGITEFVKHLNKTKNPLHKPIYIAAERDGVQIEVAMQYNDGYLENVLTFANSINTPDGGTHLSGFKTALTRVLNTYARRQNLLKEKDRNFSGEDVREGLAAVISVLLPDPQFESQTKVKLCNPEVDGLVNSVVGERLMEFLEENPRVARLIINKAITAARAREAARRAADLIKRKSALDIGGLPGKLFDCSSRSREETELFIVEGDSAAGTAKMGRNSRFQAVLPLGGKPLNVEKSRLDKILNHEHFRTIITAIGTGIADPYHWEEIREQIAELAERPREEEVPAPEEDEVAEEELEAEEEGNRLGADSFNLRKLRYQRIVIMSVDHDEWCFLRDPQGTIRAVRIGEFIDEQLKGSAVEVQTRGGVPVHRRSDLTGYQVLCFDRRTQRVRFKPIRQVLRHPLTEPLYEITTAYGRTVRVTAAHSIFTYENGRLSVKRGAEVRPGDWIVAPGRLPLVSNQPPKRLDLLRALWEVRDCLESEVWVRGPAVAELFKVRIRREYADPPTLGEPRVTLPEDVRQGLAARRRELGLSQRAIGEAVGICQPVTFHAGEQGPSRSTVTHFRRYVEALAPEAVRAQVEVGESRRERTWRTQGRNSGRNRVREAIRLQDLTAADLEVLGEAEVELSATHYAHRPLPRFLPVNADLLFLLGFFVAEGSCSERNGVRWAVGQSNEPGMAELRAACERLFGPLATYYPPREGQVGELKIVHRTLAAVFAQVFGFAGQNSARKRLPDLVFNVSPALQLAFLRGYFLGEGSLSPQGLSFLTTSRDLASQLAYLLLAHGIVASISRREPTEGEEKPAPAIPTRHPVYTLTIAAREDVAYLQPVWEAHPGAAKLAPQLTSAASGGVNPRFRPVGGDLIALPVRRVRRVEPTTQMVYDFSVAEEENFICGLGGLCCHNSDADVDGNHIRTLLLTFFFRYLRPLMELGHIYIAQPPLFGIKVGQKIYYAHSEEERDAILAELGSQRGVEIQRYKGLGEMNAEQLAETTMNRETRSLLRVTVEDAVKADEIMSILMGSAVEPRKQFIVEHAKRVKDLDI